MSLYTLFKEIDPNNAIDCICDIASFDLDFTGENGEDYLWDEAREKGFNNNLDFVRVSLKDLFYYKDTREKANLYDICDKFFDMWLNNDGYYNEYNYTIIPRNNDYILFLAYTCSC